ncbi:hypothetical protein F5B20DRAFT_570217 [Whalleya microplaca]|nr:hypothetical protein F5B20DRAFT_570217 [Whalleya microplaca]
MTPLLNTLSLFSLTIALQQLTDRLPCSDNASAIDHPISASASAIPIYIFAGCPFRDNPDFVKVASNQAILASSSALRNITALLPPALLTYLDTTIEHLSGAVTGSNEYFVSQGVSPTLLYSTIAGTAAALAVPYSMSRWWSRTRGSISPFTSQADSQNVPHVTDEDFSYITSEDLESSLAPPARTYTPQVRQNAPNVSDDYDLLMIKSNNVNYPIRFPGYSINDGKLLVKDVKQRAGLVMNISERRARHMKMYYKGRQLTEEEIPIRDYGIRNNSELLVAVPEGRISDADDTSTSEEATMPDPKDQQKSKKNKNKKSKSKKKKDRTSPPESTANLEVPGQREGGNRSPDPSRHPSRVPSPVVPNGPKEKLEAIRSHFETELQPLCQDFIENPPKDAKKRGDEYRKLSETVFQHVLLKLDEVDTGGDAAIRARRKELVNYVQGFLNGVDKHKPTK